MSFRCEEAGRPAGDGLVGAWRSGAAAAACCGRCCGSLLFLAGFYLLCADAMYIMSSRCFCFPGSQLFGVLDKVRLLPVSLSNPQCSHLVCSSMCTCMWHFLVSSGWVPNMTMIARLFPMVYVYVLLAACIPNLPSSLFCWLALQARTHILESSLVSPSRGM